MTDELVFYHNPQCRSRIMHWMVEEVRARPALQWAAAKDKASLDAQQEA